MSLAARGALLAILCVVAACVAPAARRAHPTARLPRDEARALMQGAALYDGYCAGCHGEGASGDGPIAVVLGLDPADVRTVVAAATDDELVRRLMDGDRLPTAPDPDATDRLHVEELERHLAVLGRADTDRLRTGRVVYERACVGCHGFYGDGADVDFSGFTLPANLEVALTKHTDASLAEVVRSGVDDMVPLYDPLEDYEIRALTAYVRTLSPGLRLYDGYCAACHGDDGRGVHPEDAMAPAVVPTPLQPEALMRLPADERRARILHMFRRQQGLMPHFRGVLDDGELRAILAYLRATS
jgi:mono/diheme cytochrome c family protein